MHTLKSVFILVIVHIQICVILQSSTFALQKIVGESKEMSPTAGAKSLARF